MDRNIDGDVFGTECGKGATIEEGESVSAVVAASREFWFPVSCTFVGPLNKEKPSILHRCDTEGKCCTLAGTPKENTRDMIAHGNANHGKRGKRKLTADDVLSIRKRLLQFSRKIGGNPQPVDLADEFGVCVHTISRIRTRAKRGGWCGLSES